MKRVLSLVLALVMVLGTLPMAFAADETAGEMLQAAGFVAGDENGNLMEDQSLTRAELAVLVAELNGVKENAKTYAIAPEFKDVKADDWFGPYVAYAAKEGWFKGDTEGNFNPTATVSDQTMATVMLRALGYEPAWETAVSEAKAMGLPVGAADAAMMTRGEAFATMWGVVNTPKKDSDVALGVELGKIEPAQEEVEELVAEIDFAKAFANNKVNVDFKADVDAAAAGEVSNYTIVEKADTTKEIAVIAVVVENGDDVALETEALTAGKAYTVMVGDSKANFAGVKKDTEAPKLDSVKGSDSNEIEVVFEEMVDRATAEDVANYTLSKEGTVVKAELDEDRDTVTLTVEGMTSSKSQMITVANVTNVDGVVMSKATRSFGPKFDKSAPKLENVKASAHNNVEIVVEFDDDHGVDQATAEDVSNYSVDGLEIISAKATYINSDKQDTYYDKVILTTSEQTKSKRYELKVNYMLDGSTAANATTKVLSEKFTGGSEDDDKPKVTDAVHRNLSEIVVTFEEENALDPATALDAGNYTFKDDKLDVLSVRFDDEDENGNTYDIGETGDSSDFNKDSDVIKVILTVSEMEEDTTYKLYVNNVADNFGNAMDKADDENVRIKDEVLTYAQIEKVTATNLEKIVVKFDMPVYEAGAEDPTNYVINNSIGAVKKATWSSSDEMTVTLEVPELTENKTYEIVVNNVENTWGYFTEDSKLSFIAKNDTVDTERPEVDDVDYDFHGEIRVTFTEAVDVATSGASPSTMVAADGTVFNAVATLEDDTVVVFDAYSGNDADATAVNAKLNETYVIASFTNVKDEAGNTLDYTANDEDFTTASDTFAFGGTPTAAINGDVLSTERVTNDGVSQENGNVIHATFDREIKLNGSTIEASYYNKSSDADDDSVGKYVFNAEIDDDDDKLLILTLTGTTDFPEDEVEIRFNFAGGLTDSTPVGGAFAGGKVTDLLGRDANAKIVKIDVDNDDDVEPTLNEVVVVDKETLHLNFDEKLKSTGSYKIWDEDEEEWISNSASFDDDDLRDVVVLTITDNTKLTTNNYTLSYSSSPRDLAGNKVEDEDDTFSFVGVTTSKAVKMIAGSVVNPIKFEFINKEQDFLATDKIVVTKTHLNDEGTGSVTETVTYTGGTLNSDADKLTFDVAVYNALLKKAYNGQSVTYSFKVTNAADVTYKYASGDEFITQSFTGTLTEEECVKSTTTTAANSVFLTTGISFDKENYDYFLVTATGGSTQLVETATASNEVLITESGNFIKIEDEGAAAGLAGGTYKLVAYPVDGGATQGIEYITQAFTW